MTQTEVRRLYRSRKDRMVAGVAAGLGEFLGIDSTIMRLIFVFSLFLGGTGLLVYFVMLLVVPEEPLAVEAPKAMEEIAPEPKKRAAKKTGG